MTNLWNICPGYVSRILTRSRFSILTSTRITLLVPYPHTRSRSSTAMSSLKWKCSPRTFPTSEFQLLDPGIKIEKERLPTYFPEKYYPVRQGEIFNNRYQAIAKIGFGVTSTVWFAHNLAYIIPFIFTDYQCWATSKSINIILKIYISGQGRDYELNIYKHINSINTDHPGKKYIYKLLDYFYISNTQGCYFCLVYQALGINTSNLLQLKHGY